MEGRRTESIQRVITKFETYDSTCLVDNWYMTNLFSVGAIPFTDEGFPLEFDVVPSPELPLLRAPLSDEDSDGVGTCIPIVTTRERSGVTARSVTRISVRPHESFFLPSASCTM